MNDIVIKAENLSKSYGDVKALDKVDLVFRNNHIYGLFGRNGAGKTTLLDILSMRIFADTGSISCNDDDLLAQPGTLSDSCCYMPEKHYFPPKQKVKKIMKLAQETFPRYEADYAERLCKRFQLKTNRQYSQLSRGQQSVLRIVLGLASQAPITIFDEPTLGLDAAARDRFYEELITDFSRNPRLIILSTHLIDESTDLFNEAIIIREGRIVRQGEIDDLLGAFYSVTGKSARMEKFLEGKRVHKIQNLGNQQTAVVEGPATEAGNPLGLHLSPLSFQNLFITLTEESREASHE